MARAAVLPATTLVPPNRLAELLVQTRHNANLSLRDVEARAFGRFSVGELQLIETGAMALADDDLRAIARIYHLDLGSVAPSRAVLEIDRSEGRLVVADSRDRFLPGDDDRQIMLRYLALVYRLRNQTPGAILPARVDDLEILAQVFGTSADLVRSELEGLMGGAAREIKALHRTQKRRVAIPAIGILVALTAAGGLLLTSRTPQATAAPLAPGTAIHRTFDIGTPLVIHRDDATATPDVSIGEPLVIRRDDAVADRDVNIGTPLVIHRDDAPSGPDVNIGEPLVIERGDQPS